MTNFPVLTDAQIDSLTHAQVRERLRAFDALLDTIKSCPPTTGDFLKVKKEAKAYALVGRPVQHAASCTHSCDAETDQAWQIYDDAIERHESLRELADYIRGTLAERPNDFYSVARGLLDWGWQKTPKTAESDDQVSSRG